MTICEMRPGQKGNVVNIVKGSNAERRLFEIGIVPGTEIEVISRHPFHGPVILQIGNSRIALGRGIADSVRIELKD